MEKQPVPVPAAVYEGLEAVRLSGATNMFDRPRVIELAEVMGYDETAAWVRDHRSAYAHLLFAGVIVEEGGR
ncbi:MAG: hypothetical protein BWY25_02707 [Chloroflexi bacterium ADurb.Bin222]|nr:MAG: hypothetical protein BWY25_02707 [Chloroflexi bacterium ADurb.Bin222]